MHRNIGICVIARSAEVRNGVRHAIDKLHSAMAAENGQLAKWHSGVNLPQEEIFNHLLSQAKHYLRDAEEHHQFSFHICEFCSAEEARTALMAADSSPIDVIIADDILLSSESGQTLCQHFWSVLECNPGRVSSYSFLLSLPDLSMAEGRSPGMVALSIQQEAPLIWEMQILKTLMDHLDSAYINKLLARTLAATPTVSTTARFIHRFMSLNFPDRWDFHYYTGSMISGFIDSMFRLSENSATLCESGPNEHSLAVSALCGWQLSQRGYVIAITSGMIDEFRGTLYNLKRANAPGIILCADSPDTSWFPFQGTMHCDYDGRETLAAKGIPCVYLNDKSTLADRLAEVARIQQTQPGPVFVIATQQMLECVLKEGLVPAPEQCLLPVARSNVEPDRLAEVMNLLNHSKRRILWQCSHLTDHERDLVYRIARKAGIALADSMVSPGSVCDYYQQQPVDNYVGTFSVYGFNRKVFRYLHQEQQLADPASQSLFFLKSKVDQAASPLSPGKLKNKCHIVQVNRKQEHISPFTDLGVVSALLPFLESVYTRLDVDSEVLDFRQSELDRVQAEPETMPSDWLSQLPMSPNFFFASLGSLLHQKIVQDGYRYLGVYDVGRCGMSAIRNLPKTDKGFSGWYGRALMGDALMALPYLARTSKLPILAFIGDGARALVPDIERQTQAALAQNPHRDQISITVFYLCNGVLSMIRSYLDNRSASSNTRQVSLLQTHDVSQSGRLEGRYSLDCPPIVRERWERFDPEQCQARLTKQHGLHFIDVVLAHNSDGDGLSLLSEAAWHRINVA
ncbi:hypothetical protein L6J37_19665 [Photobacterium sp. WH77]|uniref:hypothetical protein n=1 Tax=unclassified Photobacterium TaxID=2628852 RepID=UPI001EDB6DC0|nr:MULTISPECIES: hypothetical protein [unclassified Photobacterium]MCG2839055.1 hypothetical protein [Photobacterium sp. WH77]MCG2846672.1 hypothetical protein [Photobacterium sp. WH80]